MFVGTGSGVGKSIVVAALCRCLWKKGVKVAPFKAQNMALNSFVTHDGLEMGRAQVYQAQASGLLPDVKMNPILLKPTENARSQVIVMGRPVGHYRAKEYYKHLKKHKRVAQEAFDSLASDYDVIVLEGAGSPAEINLQAFDIVNMNMAAYASCPVIMIGDIDKGGVFAWLKGTYDLIQRRHRKLVAGYLINKFRGDLSLLEPGIEQFHELVGLRSFGVLPWLNDICVDQEDSVHIKQLERKEGQVKIAVLHLSRISNFTDFAPFSIEPDVGLYFVRRPEELTEDLDCLIIPGTKSTRAELAWLKEYGWTDAILQMARRGIMILGICGGYQILGLEVRDPEGAEGLPGTTKGLGLLPIVTHMDTKKHLTQTMVLIDHPFLVPQEQKIHGYEIHMGKTYSTGKFIPLGKALGASIGACAVKGPIIGTYLHGLFENDRLRRHFLNNLRRKKGLPPIDITRSYEEFRQAHLDKLASWFQGHADLEGIMKLLSL